MPAASAASPSGLGTYPTTTVPMVSPLGAATPRRRPAGTVTETAGLRQPVEGWVGRSALGHSGPVAPPLAHPAALRDATHPALQAPIDRHTHAVLRAATRALVEGETRRRFPVTVHAGAPGLSVRHVEDPPLPDAAARADVVLALLRASASLAPRPALWLTRPGE